MHRSAGVAALILVSIAGWLIVAAPTSEVERLQGHFDRVLMELRATAPGGLGPGQRAARRETIAWLEEYRDAGVFPHNHIRPGERFPVFVDHHGTPCAVGYLMLRSGEYDLVEEIVRTDVLVRVPELSGHPGLQRWLEDRGLSLAEAARIQPTYSEPEPTDPEPPSYYRAETVGMSVATAAVAAYVGLTSPHLDRFEWGGALSLGTMAGHGVLLGLIAGQDPEVGAWEIGLNVAGTLVSAGLAASRFAERAALSEQAAVQPIVSAGGDRVTLGLEIRH